MSNSNYLPPNYSSGGGAPFNPYGAPLGAAGNQPYGYAQPYSVPPLIGGQPVPMEGGLNGTAIPPPIQTINFSDQPASQYQPPPPLVPPESRPLVAGLPPASLNNPPFFGK